MANVVQILIQAKDNASRALNAPIKSLGDLKKAATALRPAILTMGAATAGALTILTVKSINAADELYKASQAVGMTTENLSTLKYAAQLSGVEFDNLKTGLQRFSKTTVDAFSGMKEAKDNFKALGISVTGTNGSLKTNEQLLGEIADKFQTMPNGAAKTAIAMELFGKSAGPNLIPMLNTGRAGIAALQKEARDLGLQVSTAFGKNAERFNDNLTKMKTVLTATGNSIAQNILPTMTSFTEALITSYKEGGQAKAIIDGIGKTMGFLAKAAVGAAGVIVGAFQAVGDTIGTVAAAWVQASTGQFKAAKETLSSGMSEVKANMEKAVMDLAAIMNGSYGAQEAAAEKNKTNLVEIAKKGSKETFEAWSGGWNQILRLDQVFAKRRLATEEDLQKERVGLTANALNTIAALSSAKNKEIALVGKTIGIAQATIDTYVGANKALAQGGFFGIAMAAAVIAAGLANVATIAGVELAEGGIVKARPGGIQATIGEGGQDEAVIPLDGNNALGPVISHATVELNGRTLLDFIWESSKNGMLRISPRAVYA